MLPSNPPTIRTLPSLNTDAVCWYRLSFMLAIVVQVSVGALYSSAHRQCHWQTHCLRWTAWINNTNRSIWYTSKYSTVTWIQNRTQYTGCTIYSKQVAANEWQVSLLLDVTWHCCKEQLNVDCHAEWDNPDNVNVIVRSFSLQE